MVFPFDFQLVLRDFLLPPPQTHMASNEISLSSLTRVENHDSLLRVGRLITPQTDRVMKWQASAVSCRQRGIYF